MEQQHASLSSSETLHDSTNDVRIHSFPEVSLDFSTPDQSLPTIDMTKFDTLVEALRDKLGPSSGINDSDVDPQELQSLMDAYISDESDWKKYALGDPSRPYTRNLVDKGNGKSNLLILVWSPGKASPVHDHANAHCIMKILKGQLKETRYAWPTVKLNKGDQCPLETTQETIFSENEVTYMSDKLGLHKITNVDPNDFAISLHLYTPPNASVYGCNTFNERTGQPSHQKTCPIFSEYGRRTKL